jgi:D-alanyl-D-alanine-carboxypeptidase/D-alanyl-D-alanine-endopeptidase
VVRSMTQCRPLVVLGLLAAAHAAAAGAQTPTPTPIQTPAPAPRAASNLPWIIPSNEKIAGLLAERMKHNGVGIVIGVIEPSGQRVVAYGKSGAKDGRPLDGDTVFQIGSVTKTFTALLLADMALRGEVKLEDPAAKYLPQGLAMATTGAADARPITLHHLSTHTSGLPSMPRNFDPHGQPNPVEAYTVDNLYQFVSTFRLPREPGEKFEYSNLGVSLLGRLLGRRAGMEYEALVKQRVLDPLGLKSTSITLTPDQTARLAPGHNIYLQPEYVWEMKSMPASGSLRSTANDLLRFVGAYLGYQDTPLKAAMEYQLTPRLPPNGSQPMLLAWGSRKVGDQWVYLHDGGKSGYRSGVAFNIAARTGVVALANARTDDRPMDIAYHLLTGRPLQPAPPAPMPRKIVTVDRQVLDSYEGRYEEKPGSVFDVVRHGDHLLVASDGDEGAFFYPTSSRDFGLSWGNDEVSFEMDDAGRVTSLRYYPDGRQGDGREGGSSKEPARFQLARRVGK